MKSRLAQIDAGLAAAVVPGRAAKEKAYLKSALTHLGVPVPRIRKIARAAADGLDGQGARALAEALWQAPVHERRVAAVEVLVRCVAALRAGDLQWIERLLREARTWALVDPLAIEVVGRIVAAAADDPAAGETLDRWIADDDKWIRRAAMLALLRPLRQGEGDWERFVRYADRTLEERDFFIRKAIGWTLREAGKKRPDRVAAFLAPRTDRASGVTMREAVKPLDEETRARLLEAHRARRAARPEAPELS